MQPRPKVSFPDLDGLRFVAFFAVFLSHGVSPWASEYLSPALVSAIFGRGIDGVYFFFVLSGFLITYLLLTELETTGTVDVAKFYVRRALRIWPLYYSLLAVCIVVFPRLMHHPTEVRSWPFVVFLANFECLRAQLAGISVPGCMNVMWSVAVEEQFYFVWPLVVLLLRGLRLPLVIGAIIVGSAAFRYVHPNRYVIATHSIAVFGDLAIGALAAWVARKGGDRVIRDLSRGWIIVAYVLGMSCFFLFREQRVLISLFFAFVVVEQCFGTRSFYKMSNRRYLSQIGTYTYGLYLLHELAILIVARATSNVAVIAVLSLPLSLVIALVSYRFLESPALRLKARFAVVERG